MEHVSITYKKKKILWKEMARNCSIGRITVSKLIMFMDFLCHLMF